VEEEEEEEEEEEDEEEEVVVVEAEEEVTCSDHTLGPDFLAANFYTTRWTESDGQTHPALQEQINDPAVLVHAPKHGVDRHSSMSVVQFPPVLPPPAHPPWQAQVGGLTIGGERADEHTPLMQSCATVVLAYVGNAQLFGCAVVRVLVTLYAVVTFWHCTTDTLTGINANRGRVTFSSAVVGTWIVDRSVHDWQQNLESGRTADEEKKKKTRP
jgi:hypothetical protein